MTVLSVRGEPVASYVVEPEVDRRHGRRPYLHPVRTLGGVLVTDLAPEDHVWHLGASLAVQDVAGANLWGGRTYVRGQGYTWRADHGAIVHTAWLPADDGVAHLLEWRGPDDEVLLVEERRISAAAAPGGWELTFAFTLSAERDVALGSPATNGRPGGAGYGGFFWRAAPGPARVFTAEADGEEAVNGSAAPWVALTGPGPYTLVFRGLSGADRWFVRTGIYPGVCAALAFDEPLVVRPDAPVSRRYTVLVADGEVTPE